MKSIITVFGKDQSGITASVSQTLANSNVNILDIQQTILQEYFTMIMIVDISKCTKTFKDLREELNKTGTKVGVSVNIQREDIFNSMQSI